MNPIEAYGLCGLSIIPLLLSVAKLLKPDLQGNRMKLSRLVTPKGLQKEKPHPSEKHHKAGIDILTSWPIQMSNLLLLGIITGVINLFNCMPMEARKPCPSNIEPRFAPQAEKIACPRVKAPA